MTAERCEVVSAFKKAKLPRRAIPQVDENMEFSTASDTLASEADPSLSVSAEDSGFVFIPLVTLNKAYELLSAENANTPAPGSDTKARIFFSFSKCTTVALMADSCVVKTAFSEY